MTYVCDFSFAHNAIDFAHLVSLGITGGIGYVSDDPSKNLTTANLQAMLAAGMTAGLVFEDTVNDMQGGAQPGNEHGLDAATEAIAIGYDYQNCVIFAANDRNASGTDFPTILAYMEAFAQHVPVPGYYGDQDSIDFLWSRHPEWFYWQSNSTAFGNGVSARAHLVQQYNHPLAAGLDIDVDVVQIPGISLMGDDMYTQADRDRDNHMATVIGLDYAADQNMLPAVAEMRGNVQNIVKGMVSLGHPADAVAIANALAPLLPNVTTGELQAAVGAALARLQVTVTVPPPAS